MRIKNAAPRTCILTRSVTLALMALTWAPIVVAQAQDSTVQPAQEESQATTPDQPRDETAKDLARIQVTGSNIRRSDLETASPVQVIDKKTIENMGANTLLQVLDNLPAMRPAQVDSKSLFTGSDGASQANLRGLGAQGTLVLLNGRRLCTTAHRPASRPSSSTSMRFRRQRSSAWKC